MTPGLVSVMMPAYNAERYIGQAIESVLAQRYSHWELIVVNDGSSDGTAGIVAGYKDPRIRVFHQKNQGESAARNRSLDEMRGQFVAFLDADDVFYPHHLELTVGHLQEHPQWDAVYTDGYHCDEEGNRLAPLSSRRRGPFTGDIFEELVRASDVHGPPTCVVLHRRPILEQDLRFDPEIVIGPDWEFMTRYAQWTQFAYLDDHTVLYRIHQTNISVRVGLQRRAIYIARCREKAFQLQRFRQCSLETQVAVFYDLLVNLLVGHPQRQQAIMEVTAFRSLPAVERARLLRLAAGRALSWDGDRAYVGQWLREAQALNPSDLRNVLLSSLYRLHPSLCRLFVRLRTLGQTPPLTAPPFSDLRTTD